MDSFIDSVASILKCCLIYPLILTFSPSGEGTIPASSPLGGEDRGEGGYIRQFTVDMTVVSIRALIICAVKYWRPDCGFRGCQIS